MDEIPIQYLYGIFGGIFERITIHFSNNYTGD
jgi:hypothetical protein